MLDTFGRGPPKDHFSKVWLRLAQYFQRRRFFFNFIPPFSIFSLASILVGIEDHRTQFWKGVIQGPFHQSLVAIGTVVSEEKFLCEFPIWFYVKLSSAVGAILVKGPNRRTYYWKRTTQWLFHQHLVLIGQMVSDKKIFLGISHRVLC